MPPEFFEGGKRRKHPLEELFNAPAWEMLDAIEQGHRAKTDVKGKLAEFYLNRQIQDLLARKVIDSVTWSDKDGEPDFLIEVAGEVHRVEVKNVRSGPSPRVYGEEYRLELQKTRNAIGGGPARSYRTVEFDIIAACLFNQTGQWDYLFVASSKLERNTQHPDYLQIFHVVPRSPSGVWRKTLEEAIGDLK